MVARVVALHSSPQHTFSKQSKDHIKLLEGIGVEGDAHAGETVKHRSRVRHDPSQPNLRQVHLLHVELLDELQKNGFTVRPGDIGENITTQGIHLLGLPRDTMLWIGATAAVRVTGLRNPCAQLDRFQSGLMDAVLDKDAAGRIVRKSGIMGVVVYGGSVLVDDEIRIELPPEPHYSLDRV